MNIKAAKSLSLVSSQIGSEVSKIGAHLIGMGARYFNMFTILNKVFSMAGASETLAIRGLGRVS
jgi:hypothetical protein